MTTVTIDPFASATDMLKALLTKEVSSVELLDLHLTRIEEHNPKLNAIVVPDFANARKAAVSADQKRSAGEGGALLGLPMTIKECFDVDGLPNTAGAEQWADNLSSSDSLIAARVKAAGAVIMGKTNLPTYARDSQSNNPIYGRTRNPWDLGRSPGGSSGGSAAALAAGLTPLEFGNDIAGSVRFPAAFCGVYGHKSSETALPRSGGFPGSELPNPAAVMAVAGPLARSAEDLELAFDVVAGPDIVEEVAWRLDMPSSRHQHLSEFRVAILPSIPWLPVDSEIMNAVENLAKELSKKGATVKEAQPPVLDDMRQFYQTFCRILRAVTSMGTPEEVRMQEADEARTGLPFGEFLAQGMLATANEYMMWLRQREVFRRSFVDFFDDWDVLLAPVNIVPAFPHTDAPLPERRLDINGVMEPYGLQLVYSSMANLCGQPSTAFPVGLTRKGLPIGLQARRPVPGGHDHYALCRPRGEGIRRVPAAAGLLT